MGFANNDQSSDSSEIGSTGVQTRKHILQKVRQMNAPMEILSAWRSICLYCIRNNAVRCYECGNWDRFSNAETSMGTSSTAEAHMASSIQNIKT